MANVAITALPTVSAPGANDYLIIQGSKTQKIAWKNLLNKIYPVGSLYMSAKATSPASLFGGTWERIKDRLILAAGDTYAAGSTGGEAKHIHTLSESNSAFAQIGSSNNLFLEDLFEQPIKQYAKNPIWKQTTAPVEKTQNANCGTTPVRGKTDAASNMPPYLTAYIWQRIA